MLDDRTARLEVSLFAEAFEQYGSKVSKDELLVVEGEIQHDEFNGGTALQASRILTVDEARQRFSRALELDFSQCSLPQGFNEQLKKLVQPYPGASVGDSGQLSDRVAVPACGSRCENCAGRAVARTSQR